MGVAALVRVRTFLASRKRRDLHTRIRREVLAGHEPALTVIVCQLWVAEIAAVAELPANRAE